MVSNDKRYADLPHSTRAFLETLDDEGVTNLANLMRFYELASKERDIKGVTAVEFLLQASPRTLRWLKEARPEEINQLDKTIRLANSGRVVGKFLWYLFATTLGAFILVSQFGDAVTKWFKHDMMYRATILISCVCGGIIGGWLGWTVSDRQNPVKYYSTEILNEPMPGEVLRVRHHVWRDRSCYTTVFRAVFDKDEHRYVVQEDLEFPAGMLPVGDDVFVTMIPVSVVAVAGPAVYRVQRLYRCNFSHWIWPVEDGPHNITFTIAPKQ